MQPMPVAERQLLQHLRLLLQLLLLLLECLHCWDSLTCCWLLLLVLLSNVIHSCCSADL